MDTPGITIHFPAGARDLLQCPHCLWGQPRFLVNWYQRLLPRVQSGRGM